MKGLFKFVVILLILVGLGAFLLGMYLDTAAKTAVEKGGTYALGVPTTLDSAALDLRGGSFALSGLGVANPDGFEGERFLALDGISLEVPITAMLSDPIEVDRLVIDGLALHLEQQSTESNAKTLLNNLQRLASGGDSEPAAEEEGAGGKRLSIREVVIKNVGVTASVSAAGKQLADVKLDVPEFTLNDVGSKTGGETVAELTSTLLREVLARVSSEGSGILPADLLGSVNQGLADLKASATGAVDEAREAVDRKVNEVTDRVADEVDAATDKVDSKVDEAKDKLQKGLEGLGGDAEKALDDASGKLGGLLGGKKKGDK